MKIAFFIAIFISGVATAATPHKMPVRSPGGLEYVIPAGSPVHFRKFGRHDAAYYTGSFYLTGRYTYGYVTEDPEADATYGRIFLNFKISTQEAKKLPYWRRDGPIIRNIYIRNPRQFAKKVVGDKKISEIKQKQLQSVSGVITIYVNHLKTYVECDQQHTSVTFISIKHLKSKHGARTVAKFVPC